MSSPALRRVQHSALRARRTMLDGSILAPELTLGAGALKFVVLCSGPDGNNAPKSFCITACLDFGISR
jgi:hypothetical protein